MLRYCFKFLVHFAFLAGIGPSGQSLLAQTSPLQKFPPESKEYYFGHHPANRLEISAGRFFEVSPKAAEGPINFLVHPYLEVEGKAGRFAGVYSFKRLNK